MATPYHPENRHPLILEGLWGVGKTTLAEAYAAAHGYAFLPEPRHDEAPEPVHDLDAWYTDAHAARDARLSPGAATVSERSILSSFAFSYALGRPTPSADYLESFKEKIRASSAGLIYLAGNERTLPDDVQRFSPDIQRIITDPATRARYAAFYTHVLPERYGIAPFILDAERDNVRRPVGDLSRDIEAMLAADRVCQVNVVCRAPSGKVLVLERSARKGGFWQTITGGVHLGEDLPSAAAREVAEELGITGARVHPCDYAYAFMGAEGYTLREWVFSCTIDDGIPVTLSDEHAQARWLSPEEAISLVRFDTNKEAIRRAGIKR